MNLNKQAALLIEFRRFLANDCKRNKSGSRNGNAEHAAAMKMRDRMVADGAVNNADDAWWMLYDLRRKVA